MSRRLLLSLASLCLCSVLALLPGDGFAEDGQKSQRDEGVPLAEANIEVRVVQTKRLAGSSYEPTPQVTRIAGCHGALDRARDTVLDFKGILEEPRYQTTSFTKPVMAVSALGEASCVTDNQSVGLADFDEQLMTFDLYLAYEVFDCRCGSCYDKSGNPVGDDVAELATEEHRQEFARYAEKRRVEIEQRSTTHQQYVQAHAQWTAERSSTLRNPAVRIAVTPSSDLPAGSIGVYSYDWYQYSWCQDVSKASRAEFSQREVPHPAVPAGHTLELWVEGVDLRRTWGAVTPQPGAQGDLAEDFERIKQASEERLSPDSPPYDKLPASVQSRAAESSKGTSSVEMDECCAC